MDYIAITSQSNALQYNYFKGFRTVFIWNIMKLNDIQTIQSKILKLIKFVQKLFKRTNSASIVLTMVLACDTEI